MYENLFTYNARFLQLSVMVIVFSSLYSNSVFGQGDNETSQISEQLRTWADWLSTPIIITVVTIALGFLIGTVFPKRWQDRRNEIELKTRLAADISECVMKTLVAIMQVEEFSEKKRNYTGTEAKVSKQLSEKLKAARDHEYYEGFKVKGHVIQSEIQAYFEGCLKAWNVLIDLVRFVEKLSEEKESGKRRHVIDCHLKHDKTLNAYEPHEEKRNQLELKEPVFKILLDDARAKYNQSQGRDRSSKRIEEEEFKEKLSKMEIEAWYEVKHVIVQRKDNIITYILHTRPKPTRLSK